jgi:hypothetical protein
VHGYAAEVYGYFAELCGYVAEMYGYVDEVYSYLAELYGYLAEAYGYVTSRSHKKIQLELEAWQAQNFAGFPLAHAICSLMAKVASHIRFCMYQAQIVTHILCELKLLLADQKSFPKVR